MSYTTSGAVLGAGSTLGFSATNSGSVTIYSELTKISLPKKSVGKIKVTNHQSTDSTMEHKPGFIDPGDVEADFNYTPATWLQVNEDVRKEQWFELTLPSDDEGGDTAPGVSATAWFYGFISEVSGESPVEDKISGKLKITLMGAAIWS